MEHNRILDYGRDVLERQAEEVGHFLSLKVVIMVVGFSMKRIRA